MIETKEIPLDHAEVISTEALAFVEALHDKFESHRQKLLSYRAGRQARYDGGHTPDFDFDTFLVRESEWQAAELPWDMKCRQVEITGPVDRKMIINALNSGADVFMADFEDSNSPTWENIINGHKNIVDANLGTIELKTDKKHYRLERERATKLMVRFRGLHMSEKNVRVDGDAVSASLFDFGIWAFNNLKDGELETPAVYLPKLEHYDEAMWWKRVFDFAHEYLGLQEKRLKATVLIETLPAAFQMDEIIFALNPYIAGLNAGRWDYIFSAIKVLGNKEDYLFPNRADVGMATHMMESYAKLIVETCHKRGIMAMGGMAAQVPRKDDKQKNEEALAKVREDKAREVALGFDGTWVAHPGLIEVAGDIFRDKLGDGNQIHNIPGYKVSREDLLSVPGGDMTVEQLKKNISVSLEYIANWIQGNGCVAIDYLMEDLATVEISRAQVWQWLKAGVWEEQEVKSLIGEAYRALNHDNEINLKAAEIFGRVVFADQFEPFLSDLMYQEL